MSKIKTYISRKSGKRFQQIILLPLSLFAFVGVLCGEELSKNKVHVSSDVVISLSWNSVPELKKMFYSEEFDGYQTIKSTRLFCPDTLRIDRAGNFYIRQGKLFFSVSSTGTFRWSIGIPQDAKQYVRDFDVDEPDKIYTLLVFPSSKDDPITRHQVRVYAMGGKEIESFEKQPKTGGGHIVVSGSDFIIRDYGYNNLYNKLSDSVSGYHPKFFRCFASFSVDGVRKEHKLMNLKQCGFGKDSLRVELPEDHSGEWKWTWRQGHALGFSKGHIYLVTGKSEAEKPETKHHPPALLAVADISGKLEALVELGRPYHRELASEIPMDKDGNIYQMVCNDSGIRIVKRSIH